MKKTSTWYVVEIPGGSFSDQYFKTKEEALGEVKDHLEGCPSHPEMIQSSRDYWKKIGKRMKIHKEKIIRTEIKFTV